MALTLECALSHILSFLVFLLIFLVNPSFCFNPKKLVNASFSYTPSASDWSPALATWYGPANGDGSEGGACGYGVTVGQAPISAMVSAGSPRLYENGKGCGSCYEVRCTGNSACSGEAVKVVMTDECDGCGSDAEYHFDLSGTAFGAMALSGQDGTLRNAGKINIQHRRVECNYPGVSIAFHVDAGSNQEYFAAVIEYEDGDGDLSKVELKEALDSASWYTMDQSWGAVWKLDKGSPLRAPFSLRLTTLESGNSIVANNVIPAGWVPGHTYRSIVNFQT
ncbi:putative expansin-B2 [Arachis stenosperma]|uniref:putative expansin-B2 n=1 Tax=Arachis stenosperma TaxID=217475 RepID=UPI0025AD2436|nr:putative expansin-B2 [Arachis stenosperma]